MTSSSAQASAPQRPIELRPANEGTKRRREDEGVPPARGDNPRASAQGGEDPLHYNTHGDA
eukprot:4826608-Heterocapsa_arctica.AAC.1